MSTTQYREANRELIRQRAMAYRLTHPERVKEINRKSMARLRAIDPDKALVQRQRKERNRSERYRARKRDWYRMHAAKPETRARRGELRRARWREDQQFRIGEIIRARLRNAVRRRDQSIRGSLSVRYLGCSVDELVVHIERQFRRGMTWENFGEWHIDHIRPLSGFDLTDHNQAEQACHFTNLRPLWAVDNMRKGAKAVYLI